MEEEKKGSNRIVLVVLLLLLLLGSIGYNVYQGSQFSALEKKVSESEKQLIESDKLKEELKAEMAKVQADLDEYKGKAESVDSLISIKEAELQEKATRINQLLKDNKISFNKYLKFKDEMEDWKYNAEKYLGQVQELTAQNKKLKEENEELKSTVATTSKEKDALYEKNTELGLRVALAAQLIAQDINVVGVKVKSSGKERETLKANQMDKLKIVFNVPENHASKDGTKTVFAKIMDPTGQPIVLENAGSGSFKVGNTEAKYTFKEDIKYDNTAKTFNIYWQDVKEAKLLDGTYTIELFTEGYKMGEKNFTVK
jgi:myosin heavy subunit